MKLRHYVLSTVVVTEQIAELRKLLMLHIENTDHKFSEHDEAITHILRTLNNLIEKPPKTKTIGFTVNEKTPEYLANEKRKKIKIKNP